jgi:single-stranded DNA-binding protein
MAEAIHAARHQNPPRPRTSRPRALPAHTRSSSTMAADNHTTIVGNLVEDPELRFTSSGIAVANLGVAVTQRIQQDGQWRNGDTSFLKVNVWRGQAEHLADSLSMGDRVMVTGRLGQHQLGDPRGRPAVGHRDRGRRGRRLPQVGPRPKSSGPASAATATAARVGSGRPNAAATSTTRRRLIESAVGALRSAARRFQGAGRSLHYRRCRLRVGSRTVVRSCRHPTGSGSTAPLCVKSSR